MIPVLPGVVHDRNRRCDRGRAPKRPPNLALQLLLDVGDDPVTHPIAHRGDGLVREIVAILQAALSNIRVDFGAADSEERSDDCELDAVDRAHRDRAHADPLPLQEFPPRSES